MFDDSIKAIPTWFRGIRYRSRLEACWACFLQDLDWWPEYEAIDLNGYIPDFILDWHVPLLIEIKPYSLPEEIENTAFKLLNSGWKSEIVVGGASITPNEFGEPKLGWFVSHEGSGDNALLGFCNLCKSPSIRGEWGSWRCRRCGGYDGNCTFDNFSEGPDRWKAAKNEVQWRGKRPE